VLLAGGLTLFLVPAILRLMGRRVHWFPTWLGHVVPHVDIEGRKLAAATPDVGDST
jgi:hypothetical protein